MTSVERRWLILFVVVVVGLCEVPYVIAFSQTANGWHFVGMLWSPHDFVQYAAAMRQGATSPSWLIVDQLTTEPHQPALVYPFYVALGKIASLVATDARIIYHLAEIAARATLVCSAYAAATLLFRSPAERRLGTVLVLFAAGLSVWLLMLAGGLGLDESSPVFSGDELKLPEVSTFLVLFTAPHLALSLAGLMTLAVAYTRAWRGETARWSAVASCLVLGLAVTNPFTLLSAGAVLTVHLAWTSISQRALPARGFSVWLAAMLAATPFFVYNLAVFGTDPLWAKTYGEQNILPPPAPVSAIIGYGAILVLAAIGIRGFLPRPTNEQRLVIVWIVLSAVMMYAPLSFGRRFAFGLHPMLALAAAAGTLTLWRRIRGSDPRLPWRARMLRMSLVVILLPTTAFSYGLFLRAVLKPTDRPDLGGAFRQSEVHQAGVWLGQVMDPTDIVVADIQTSNYIAGMVPGRAYIGHWVATKHYAQKEHEVRSFFGTSDAESRIKFLSDSRARYVVWGPREQLLGPLPNDPALRPVLTSDGLTIFEVSQSALEAGEHVLSPRAADEREAPLTQMGAPRPSQTDRARRSSV